MQSLCYYLVVPAVTKSYGPGDSGDPANEISVAIPKQVLNAVTNSDKGFESRLNQDFLFNTQIPLGTLRKIHNSFHISGSRASFFHFIRALPKLAKTIDFKNKADEVNVFNNFNHFKDGDNFKVSLTTDKRTWMLFIYTLLKTKASSSKSEQAPKIIDDLINASVDELFKLSQPGVSQLVTKDPFAAKEYLEKTLTKIAIQEPQEKVKREIGKLLERITDGEEFKFLLYSVSEKQDDIETKRDDLVAEYHDLGNKEPVSESERLMNELEAQQQERVLKQQRLGFDELLSATENFIHKASDKSGFNGKFNQILAEELEALSFPFVNINFEEYDPDDYDFFDKQAQVTLDTITDLYKLGYKEIGFANFLGDYGFADLSHQLAVNYDLPMNKVRDLALSFLNLKNKNKNFKFFLGQEGYKNIDQDDIAAHDFMDFLDKLKALKVKHQGLDIKVFGVDKKKDAQQWSEEGFSKKRAMFNNQYFHDKANGSYSLMMSFYKYEKDTGGMPGEGQELLAEELDSMHYEDFGKGKQFLKVVESIPVSVFMSQENQIKDGDVFTMAGLEPMEEDLDQRIRALPFKSYGASFDTVEGIYKPDLYKVFFMEEKDDDDGEDEFSFDKAPEGDMCLT